MSSLQRYKKSGGFYQLLSLIETFGPQKKEKFLEMIESESAAWAAALRDKMITLERIFSWPDQVVIEVFKALPPKSQAYALQGMKDDQKAKINPFLSGSDHRRVADVLTENQPKPEEIQATLFKLVEVARRMIHDRELMPDKFDAGLSIPQDFEAKLEVQYGGTASKPGSAKFNSAKSSPEEAPLKFGAYGPPSDTPAPQPDASSSAEVYQLQRTLATVLKENKTLKDEVRNLHVRLESIKKLAA